MCHIIQRPDSVVFAMLAGLFCVYILYFRFSCQYIILYSQPCEFSHSSASIIFSIGDFGGGAGKILVQSIAACIRSSCVIGIGGM